MFLFVCLLLQTLCRSVYLIMSQESWKVIIHLEMRSFYWWWFKRLSVCFVFSDFKIIFFLNFAQTYFIFRVSLNVIPLLIILRCWKLYTGFAISLHRHHHHQFVTALCTQVLSLDISPVLSHPPLRCCMRVLFSYQLTPDIPVPLFLPASERICCHLCIPTIIFWRFSPSQWKTVCLKA